ncbi:MAG: hypothetical protein K2W95_12250 [Candidatus Obscuribacterales bacterium]|nr:hypothetical protein [Candidatus Obscuribacterales bacterium]
MDKTPFPLDDPELLYARFASENGLAFVQDLVTLRAQELHCLDFKLKAGLPRDSKDKSSEYKPVPDMQHNDKATMAKGISGFSNSVTGGLLVWGVDCPNPGKSKVDAVTRLCPIPNPKLFAGQIRSEIRLLTKPAMVGVRCHAILHDPKETDEDKQTGYVILFVPPLADTELFPVISTVDGHCYMRSGASFIKPSADDLAKYIKENLKEKKTDYSLEYHGPYKRILEHHKFDKQLAEYVKDLWQTPWKEKPSKGYYLEKYLQNKHGWDDESLIPVWCLLAISHSSEFESAQADEYIDKAAALSRQLNLTNTLQFGEILLLQANSYAARGFAKEAINALVEGIAVVEKFPPTNEKERDENWAYRDLDAFKDYLADTKKWLAEKQQERANEGSNHIIVAVPPDFMTTRNKEEGSD